jgi:hypothetical protein
MRACGAVKEHGFSAGNRHVESANIGLSILKGDVATVYAGIHRLACCISSGLGDGMVAIAELELNNVADCGHNGIGDESVLRSANDYRDDLVLAAMGLGWSW